MGIRTGAQQNTLLLAALLLFGGWTALTLLDVVTSAGPLTLGNWVGQHGIGGLVGAIALLFILAFTVGVFGELGEADPTPDEWPPQ
ncbi:hypothetical protein U4E84_04570 [Halorubrum sp. AD140]|uniref:hypothetical protein n=1 Tax=Halorubrum sp. AD140 TaxID=3050073 RepID=UPI002ACCFDD0|nr:hypothetical protein [Halorubrum sp. AD140]MDZ5810619.1 hypothetical protein [Halorubrum sp. AD140]